MSPVASTYGLTEDLHPDPHNAVFWNMFYQGMAKMVPWNVILFANRYFEMRLKDVPAAANFVYYFTSIFMVMKFIFLLSGMSISRRLNPEVQIAGSIGANATVFAAITLFCGFGLGEGRTLYYSLLGLMVLAAFCGSFLEAGFLRMLTFFPQKYTQAFLMGTSCAGVFCALLHIVSSIWISSAVSNTFALVYFGSSTLAILASIFLFHIMSDRAVYRYYCHKGRSLSSQREKSIQMAEISAGPVGEETTVVLHSTTRQLFPRICDLFCTLMLLTLLNMIISPLLIVSTRSAIEVCAQPSEDRDLFHGIAFLTSSIFDLLGKALPALSFFSPHKLPFLPLAAARVLFIPALLVGNVHLHGTKLPLSLYTSDVAFMIIIGVKSLTGSFLGTLCMMRAPQRVEPIDRPLAVKLLIYAIGSGLLMGSFAALLLKHLLMRIFDIKKSL